MIQDSCHRIKALLRAGWLAPLRYAATLMLPAMILSCAAAAWAASTSYDYQVIAQSGDVIGGVTLDNARNLFIADDGTVLFIGHYNSCCEALFSKRSAAARGRVLVRQGDSIGGVTISQFRSVKRNDRGEVVFSANINDGSSIGIFRLKSEHVHVSVSSVQQGGDGREVPGRWQDHVSAVALPGETIGGFTLTALGDSFDLNDSGEIVFGGSSGSPPNALYGIFTPRRVIVQSGDVIGGLTLQVPTGPTLSKNGVVIFSAGFTDSQGQGGTGIFTRHGLLFQRGDTIDGLPLLDLRGPEISETGTVGFAFSYSFNPVQQAFAVDGGIAVKSGDVIDGFTIAAQPDGIPFPATFNANGDVLFETFATDSSGTGTFGLFTQDHSVAANGDMIAGITVQPGFGSINDAGQIAFPTFFGAGQTALIVATPNGN